MAISSRLRPASLSLFLRSFSEEMGHRADDGFRPLKTFRGSARTAAFELSVPPLHDCLRRRRRIFRPRRRWASLGGRQRWGEEYQSRLPFLHWQVSNELTDQSGQERLRRGVWSRPILGTRTSNGGGGGVDLWSSIRSFSKIQRGFAKDLIFSDLMIAISSVQTRLALVSS